MSPFALILSLLATLYYPSTNPSLKPDQYFVRIAVLKEAKSFNLSIRGQYSILDPLSDLELKQGRTLRETMVTARNNGIQVGKDLLPLKHLRILSMKDIMIDTGEKSYRYRGMIDIVLDPFNELLVINTLDLETYVKGVLYHEVSHRWPLEAIKAQAVATRTYALYQIQNSKAAAYDVTSDIYSQVYGGRSAERYRTNIAANRTKEEILIYDGKVLPAYFHATCGGHTENARELWDQDIAALKGVVCPYCVTSPHYIWKKNFRLKDIQDKLNRNGYHLGLIEDITVLERNESGRIRKLQITTRDGQNIVIEGKNFRNIIGPNDLKSNNYVIIMKGYYCDLIGNGWGHGVGMCQWGAYEMALQRIKYKEILAYYYPGATIINDMEENLKDEVK